jgi:hypothetical protein
VREDFMSGVNRARLYVGIALLALGVIMPFFGILVLRTDWSAAVKAPLVGLLTAGGPEVVAILAAAVLGKKNFEIIKNRVMSALRRLRPTAQVSKLRYTIGLVMFLLPVIPTYVMGYAPQWLPDTSSARLYVNIGADCMFITSLFVLGGDFWDKLTALFVYESRAQFEERPEN